MSFNISQYKDDELKPIGDGIEAMYRHIIKEDPIDDKFKEPN